MHSSKSHLQSINLILTSPAKMEQEHVVREHKGGESSFDSHPKVGNRYGIVDTQSSAI